MYIVKHTRIFPVFSWLLQLHSEIYIKKLLPDKCIKFYLKYKFFTVLRI